MNQYQILESSGKLTLLVRLKALLFLNLASDRIFTQMSKVGYTQRYPIVNPIGKVKELPKGYKSFCVFVPRDSLRLTLLDSAFFYPVVLLSVAGITFWLARLPLFSGDDVRTAYIWLMEHYISLPPKGFLSPGMDTLIFFWCLVGGFFSLLITLFTYLVLGQFLSGLPSVILYYLGRILVPGQK